MKKSLLLVLAAFFSSVSVLRADEGMWLPALISERIADMQAKGCRLTAEDIYSVNQASLKDAVVLFGTGCTGEIVSAEGLLLTNHHCGYGAIQRHSSVEHDYLKDGFWAMNRDEELPCKGLTVSFLERMTDVTAEVLDGYCDAMSEVQRDSLVRSHSKRIIERETAPGQGLKASVEALYYGNQYYLFLYRVFRDIRLVGAPPSSVGKFGGDTDNWMWPRHTGDFSIFRVYAGKDNAPADYSPENVPYRPKKFFRVSCRGVQEGDFTFVYGCPGSTREYVHSEEVRYVGEVSDPQKIALRTTRLGIQRKYMTADPKVRIQYAAKNASVANAWKKWQGESGGIARLGTVSAKQAFERRFETWAKDKTYAGLTDRLAALYARREPYYLAYEYYVETVRTVEILGFAQTVFSRLSDRAAKDEAAETFFKDYYQPIDEEIFTSMMEAFGAGVPASLRPACFTENLEKYGSVSAWRDSLFARTLFTDRERVAALTAEDADAVRADPAYRTYRQFYDWYHERLLPEINRLNEQIRLANRDYMRAQMAFEPGKAFYPDANLTLRVAYGHVAGYSPADGIDFAPVSTLRGIIEKDDPSVYDYDIPQALRDLYAAGGREDQPVCFLATNHTSGGNSGSPVLDADGHLVGINFDRVWEGTMSDLVFDPDRCRNISLDIRYLLFIVRELGHAGYLLDEMEILR